MGSFDVSKISDPLARRAFTRHLLNDIKALELMLDKGMFETGIDRIGAEQELAIVNNEWRPALNNIEIIEAVNDEHLTTEIAKFNLEINLDPYEFTGDSLKKMHTQLEELLATVRDKAEGTGSKVILTGILPTIQKSDLHFENMTPNVRYEALNDTIVGQKGSEFELYIIGVDELFTKHPNILFEACNTSFQVHLQVEADDFVEKYNWAQLVAGPVLAVSANSPVLMGKRLWSETRIALFQQSVDTRNSSHLQREMEPRVGFGREWSTGNIAEMYKDNITRYSLLLSTDIEENSLDMVKDGRVPDLEALKLHNGTVYRWNRACYGISDNGKPHLRIENRYIPSGPTTLDEMANTAFWLGLMSDIPEKYKDFTEQMAFEDVRYNFYNASRTCLDSRIRWFGKSMDAAELIKDELIPMAENGLRMKGIDEADIQKYLDVIRKRVESRQNGSHWALKRLSAFMKTSTPMEAHRNLAKSMYLNEQTNKPVHEWRFDEDADTVGRPYDKVSQFMTTDLFTVTEDQSVDLVLNLMNWKSVPFIPVENELHEMVGMVTYRRLLQYFTEFDSNEDVSVRDIMVTDFPTCESTCTTEEAVKVMAENYLPCLPVLQDKKLIGIITEGDVLRVTHKTKKFSDD